MLPALLVLVLVLAVAVSVFKGSGWGQFQNEIVNVNGIGVVERSDAEREIGMDSSKTMTDSICCHVSCVDGKLGRLSSWVNLVHAQPVGAAAANAFHLVPVVRCIFCMESLEWNELELWLD